MQLKRTLFRGGLASMLLLAACNGENTEEAGTEEQQPAEETTGEETSEALFFSYCHTSRLTRKARRALSVILSETP